MMVAQDRNSDNWRSQATRAIGFYCEQMSFAKPEEVQKKRDWKNNYLPYHNPDFVPRTV
jgi:hypothetical protein